MRVVCLLFNDSTKNLKEIAESCYRLSPQISISRQAIFIEIGKCQKLYSESGLVRRLLVLLRRFGTSARISIGPDIPSSLAFARYQINDKVWLPIDALSDFAKPFGCQESEVQKKLDKMVFLFKKLGLLTIQDFLKLPSSSLSSRFGELALIARHNLERGHELPWVYFIPQDKIRESLNFDSTQSICDLEPLLFIAKGLIDRAMARLRGRGERAMAILFSLKLEPYSTVRTPVRHFEIHFSLPHGSVISLLPILREKLSFELSQRPLESPLIEAHFEITERVPGQGSQIDFFSKKEEELEAWNSLVTRLSEKLSQNSKTADLKVFVAHPVERFLPEKGWIKKLEMTDVTIQNDESYSLPERPLRVLKQPQPIDFVGNRILFERKPLGKIMKWEGPEILRGEWWFDIPERHYYRVLTDSCQEFWLFKTPSTQEFYLHGYFD